MNIQELFRGYTGSHGVSIPTSEVSASGKVKHNHFTKPGAPSEAEWAQHLEGEGKPGLGVIPLLDDNENVMWGAIDVDKYKGTLDHAKLEQDISRLPLVITKSKSGGAHLWLFCSQPTPAKLVIEKLSEWAAALGFGGCEVFPKQHKRLVGKQDQGNWINMPYYGGTRRCVYKGSEVNLATFEALATARLIDEEILTKIKIVSSTPGAALFDDGPPCLQTLLAHGIGEGGRNNALFNVGIYFKTKYGEDEVHDRLMEFNREYLSAPLPDHEIKNSSRTVEKKGYNYTCSKHPISGFCNRQLCMKREFGVASTEGSKEDGLNVMLTGLTKINTTDPRWLVNIDGIRAEIPETTALMDQKKFGIIVVEKVHKVLLPVTAKKWQEEIQRLLDGVEIIEAPPEASPEGQLFLHFAQYVDLKKTDSRDSLALGNVWLCEKCNRVYFQSSDFEMYLRRQGFRDLKMNRIFELFNDEKLTRGRFNIKGKQVTFWSMPAPQLQTEAYDVPKFQSFEEANDGTNPINGEF